MGVFFLFVFFGYSAILILHKLLSELHYIQVGLIPYKSSTNWGSIILWHHTLPSCGHRAGVLACWSLWFNITELQVLRIVSSGEHLYNTTWLRLSWSFIKLAWTVMCMMRSVHVYSSCHYVMTCICDTGGWHGIWSRRRGRVYGVTRGRRGWWIGFSKYYFFGGKKINVEIFYVNSCFYCIMRRGVQIVTCTQCIALYRH